MNKYTVFLGIFLMIAGCGDDTSEPNHDGTAGHPSAGAGGSDTGGSGSSGQAGSSDAGAGGEGGNDSGGSGQAGSSDAGAGGEGGNDSGGSGQAGSSNGGACEDALHSLLGPVDKVSEGEVIVIKEEGGTKTLYVDASAGGQQAAPENPWVYLDLVSSKRVDLADPAASSSSDWDLSLKRAVISTNSGDAGPGQGGAIFLPGKTLEQVSSEDASNLVQEAFVSEDCLPILDAAGSVKTSFSDWYDYNPDTHQITPKSGVYVVKGAKGALFKVEIVGFYGKSDGALDGMTGGRFILRIAGL